MTKKNNPIILILVFFFVKQIAYSSGYNLPSSIKWEYLSSITDTSIKYPDSINKARMIQVVSGFSVAYVGSMSYLQYIWYKDHERVAFHYYNDLGGYNQVDKFGHMFGSYTESYIGFHSLLWSGVDRKKAIWYGGALGFILQFPIEVWDGMYEGWGFSWSDVGANTLGSAIVIGQELIFHEQLIKYKFSFNRSEYAPQANGYLGEGFNELFYDYNGHTYWLSCGMNRIVPSQKIPDWLNVAVGYGAGGMFGEFDNQSSYHGVDIPETERYRQFYLSLDIDFSKIPVKNKVLKTIFNSFFMIKVPFPALEINTKGDFTLHPY